MSLASISIRRPIFLTCIVIVSLLVGTLSLFKLGVDQFPDVTFPVVVTTIGYPGASPKEIETLVSKPVEEEVSSTSGLKRVISQNQDGLTFIIAEFSLGTDVKYAEQQIRDKVSRVRSKLPKDIDEPVISRVDVADQPVMQFSLLGDLKPAQLYDVAENDVKPLLEQTNDVGKVEIIGGTKREIRVEADRYKLKEHELSITALASRIAASAQNVPVGKIDSGKKETSFRTIGEYQAIDQIKNTVVNFFGSDVPVSVNDVATVSDSVVDEKSRGFQDGKPAILLSVHKQSGSNTVAVADALRKTEKKINDLLGSRSGNLKFEMVRDGARFIRLNVEDVKLSIIYGALLAVAVVFLFLGNLRSTIITGLALPNSLLGAFILMYAMGFTINILTLLALSLAVGLLIDDAIVVRENIFRRIEEGESALLAAEHGTNEVALAVIATSLTVIAVFLPVGFLSGVIGQFFKQFGLTVVFAMAISLFDALTMAPMLSAYFAGPTKKSNTKDFKLFHRLTRLYERILKFTLDRPGVILTGATLLFCFSVGLGRHVSKTFLPNFDSGEFVLDLEMPPGTNLDEMEATSRKIEDVLKKHREVTHITTTVGNDEGESNIASMYVALVDYRKRSLHTTEFKDLLRRELAPYAQAKPRFFDIDASGAHRAQFELFLTGNKIEDIAEYAHKLVERFKRIPGFVDVDDDYRNGKPEFQVQLVPQKLEQYGVLSVEAGTELRGLVDGIVPAKFRENRNEYDIRIRLKPEQRDLEKFFPSTFVPNINGNLVRLSDIAKGVSTHGESKIIRLNRARSVEVSGDVGPGGALGDIRDNVEKILKEEKPPEGVVPSFQGQAEDFVDLFVNMTIAIGLAVVFMYMILSSLYESFIIPFTIMLALPFAVVGALIALFVTHENLNIFSMIGVIMLLGLVAKNSILLVDYTLQLMRQGIPRKEALMHSGLKRLRPILMTTVALIAGMLPIALGLSEAARSRTAMGIAIIGGLISSTLLTLVVVPAAFGFIDDFRNWSGRLLRRIFVADQSPSKSPMRTWNESSRDGGAKSLDR